MTAGEQLSVGFIGMGIMGSAMAGNILKAGFPLTVYNRTPGKTETLRQAGAGVSASPAEVAAASDVVITCLTDSPDVLEVVIEGANPVLEGVRAGATVIDCSTVAAYVAERCAAALRGRSAGFLDGPVSGGDVGARNGTLSIMVGGDEAHFQRALPVFQAMGKTITHCGGPGAGYVTKLCNQICGAVHLLAAAEALSLAQAAGIDGQAMLRAVSSGAAASWMLSNLAPKMLAGDYKPGFFVDYQLKDLRIAKRLADEMRLALPAACLAEELFSQTSRQGHGRSGTQAVYQVVRNLKQG